MPYVIYEILNGSEQVSDTGVRLDDRAVVMRLARELSESDRDATISVRQRTREPEGGKEDGTYDREFVAIIATFVNGVEIGYAPGQAVTVPSRDGRGRVRATFLEACDPDEAVTVETPGGPMQRDTAWVRFDEGEDVGLTARHTYADIRRA